MTCDEVISLLHLTPLPVEGGMVRQTYISEAETNDGRRAGTAIYYLLHGTDFSHFHKLDGDEVYHFYLGNPVELVELLPDGSVLKTILGPDIGKGNKVQHWVRSGNYQGSHLLDESPDSWALLGTTMTPGYSGDCYTHGSRGTLLEKWPAASPSILRLTSSGQTG